MSITIIIIAITVLVSLAAFNNMELMNKLIFWPARMDGPSEYHRFITSGLIHADYIHLFFNMYVLWIFGEGIEYIFSDVLGRGYLFPMLYIFGLLAASLPSFAKHREDHYYRALGASGAVGSVLFSYIYFFPWKTLYIFFAIPVPAIVFGILYLVYSAYAAKKGQDNIGHDAHFYGSLFGFVFTFVFDPSHGQVFIQQIMHPKFNF